MRLAFSTPGQGGLRVDSARSDISDPQCDIDSTGISSGLTKHIWSIERDTPIRMQRCARSHNLENAADYPFHPISLPPTPGAQLPQHPRRSRRLLPAGARSHQTDSRWRPQMDRQRLGVMRRLRRRRLCQSRQPNRSSPLLALCTHRRSTVYYVRRWRALRHQCGSRELRREHTRGASGRDAFEDSNGPGRSEEAHPPLARRRQYGGLGEDGEEGHLRAGVPPPA